MHKEEGDKGSLGGGYDQSDHSIEYSEVDQGDPVSNDSKHHEDDEYDGVGLHTNDLFGHSFPPSMPNGATTEQVQERKQEDPNDVYKVPVEASELDRSVVFG